MSLLSTSRPARRRAQFHPLTVTGVERLTDDAVAITFAVPERLREDYRFQPGQHLTLRASINGEEVRQSYSICLSRAVAERTGVLRVASARVAGGRMSNWLNDTIAVGDCLDVMTPLGSFSCPTQPGASRHHLAIAAGSGITPVLSIISSVLEEEPGRVRKCGASDCDVYYLDTSKSRRRQWCRMTSCGNREKQRRWRAAAR